jgi:hypothetical protein
MDPRKDTTAFAKLMLRLRACYSSERSSAGDWESRLAAYFAALMPYELDVVAKTMLRAIKAFPEFFPSAGQLISIAEDVAKCPPALEPEPPLAEISEPPPEMSTRNPFDALAEKWAEESASGAPWTHKQRFREFWALWESAEKGSTSRNEGAV